MSAALRLIGLGGAIATLASAFLPAVTIVPDGALTLFAISPVISGLLALTGVLGAFYAWQLAPKGQLACVLTGLLLGVLGFYLTLIEIGVRASNLEMRMAELASAANFPDHSPPIASMMMGTRLEWSWYLLAGGLLASLASALYALRARRG